MREVDAVIVGRASEVGGLQQHVVGGPVHVQHEGELLLRVLVLEAADRLPRVLGRAGTAPVRVGRHLHAIELLGATELLWMIRTEYQPTADGEATLYVLLRAHDGD